MKYLETLQSTSGQMAIGRPEIPSVMDVDFQHPSYAVVGLGAAVLGGILAVRHGRKTHEMQEFTQYPVSDDIVPVAKKSIRKERTPRFLLGAAMTGAATFVGLAAAEPYTETSEKTIEELSVVIDAGYEGYGLDVDTSQGLDTRVDAAVNAINELALDDIEVNFIAAGANPDTMGVVTDGNIEDQNEVVANFRDYLTGTTQRGSPASGGGDLSEGLSNAAASNADAIVVIAGTLEEAAQSPMLDEENLPENHKVSAIALGKPGTTVTSLGQEVPAVIDQVTNDRLVGEEDSYVAQSDEELKSVIQSIVSEQYQENKKQSLKAIDTVRNGFIGAVLALGYLNFAREGAGGLHKRKQRKQGDV